MRIGKWLYVTAIEEGQTKDVVVNIDTITLMEPSDEDNHCEIGILRGDGTCAELNLIHDFYEIVGLL